MKQNLQTLKGFRDFLPEEKRRRDFVMGKIVEVFERFGFEPLETPTLEYASLLLGKYGSEADKLVYTFEDAGGRRVGLKYDQTVPTSRVLAQYREKLPKYFRRYQIQNVFRAEKPQKGRFREFTQCDIDIFGTTSPLSDAEIVACTYQVYKNIGFPDVVIKLNDRVVITTALTPLANKKVTVSSIIQSIDKLDKTSEYEVEQELINKGLDMETAKKALETLAAAEPSDNLVEIMEAAKALGVPEEVVIYEPSLARGLDYYTGMILEVVIPEFTAGSVAGGGRYDKLIDELGGVDIPAVGLAFGFDRTVQAAEELGLLPKNNSSASILVTVFDTSTVNQSLELASALRKEGISVEVYPEVDKLGKQLKLANDKRIPFVAIIGPNEAEANKVTLKDMEKETEETLTLDQVVSRLRSWSGE
jgi:histidyl-tRNA synthetase